MSGSLDLGTFELATSCAKLLDELVFVPQVHGNQTFYHVDAPSRLCFFRIGYAEYVFLSLLDGHTTFSQAVTMSVRALGANALTQAEALETYTWALENQVVRWVDQSRRHAPVASPRHGWLELVTKLNPLWIKLPLCRPDRLLTFISRGLGWMFSVPSTLVGVALIFIAAVIVMSDWERFCRDSHFILSRDNWLWLGVSWVVLKLIHEVAHGLAAKRYHGTAREMGVLLAFLTPTAYIDLTSCWRLVSKWQRIHVAAAGMFVEMVIAAFAVLAWTQTEAPEAAHFLRDIVIMAGVTTFVFNMNPLMRLDGYYILSDLIEIPNLATEGQRRLNENLRWLFLGQTVGAPRMRGWRGGFISIYGILAAAWRLVVCASLLLAASVFARGSGTVLCLVSLICWLAPSMWNRLRNLPQLSRESLSSICRPLLVSACTAGLCGVTWEWLPWPGMLSTPGIVDYQDVGVIRSRTAGFVTAVHVRDGQSVVEGALLLELRNEELAHELRAMELEIRQSDVQRHIAQQQGRAGESQVLERNRRALEERLAELQRRSAGLQLRAPSSGRVVARNIDQLVSTYVKEGEALFTVGDDTKKELVVSIAQDQLEQVSQHIGKSVRFRVGARPAEHGVLERIDPRATRELWHPALGADTGGPLAVSEAIHADGSREVRLVEPRFRAVIKFDSETCRNLPCGEQGHAMLGRRHVPFGQYLWWLCTQWIRDCLREV